MSQCLFLKMFSLRCFYNYRNYGIINFKITPYSVEDYDPAPSYPSSLSMYGNTL